MYNCLIADEQKHKLVQTTDAALACTVHIKQTSQFPKPLSEWPIHEHTYVYIHICTCTCIYKVYLKLSTEGPKPQITVNSICFKLEHDRINNEKKRESEYNVDTCICGCLFLTIYPTCVCVQCTCIFCQSAPILIAFGAIHYRSFSCDGQPVGECWFHPDCISHLKILTACTVRVQ